MKKNTLVLLAFVAIPLLAGCNNNDQSYTATIKGDHITETSFNFTDKNHSTHTIELEVESGYTTTTYSISDEDAAVVSLSDTTLTVTPTKNQDFVIMINAEKPNEYNVTFNAGIGTIAGVDQTTHTISVPAGACLNIYTIAYAAELDEDHDFNGWLLIEGDTDSRISLNTEPIFVDRNYTLYAAYTGTFEISWVINEEGGEPEVENYTFGDLPFHTDPECKNVKGDKADCFVGWDKEIKLVTGPMTYTAKYENQSIATTITLSGIEANTEVSFTNSYYGTFTNVLWGDEPTDSQNNDSSDSHTYETEITDPFDIVITSSDLEYINIPSNISTKVTKISYSHTVKEIKEDAFNPNNHTSLVVTQIDIPTSVRTINQEAFISIASLTTVNIENNSLIRYIGNGAFEGTSIASIQLPKMIYEIGTEVFKDCTSLTEIAIPANVITIAESAFSGCNSLITVTFADNSYIMKIGANAFSSSGIKRIKLPNTVIYIDGGAFSNCLNLETFDMTDYTNYFTIPELGSGAFEQCKKAKIYVCSNSIRLVMLLNENWAKYADIITADPVPTTYFA